MSELMDGREAPRKREQNNAGFYASVQEADPEVPGTRTTAKKRKYTRWRMSWIIMIFIWVLALFGLFLSNHITQMIQASADADNHIVVDSARVINVEPADRDSQKLQVIWGYDNNTQVTSTEVVSIGSSDYYEVNDTVSIMYLPSQFDRNVPASPSSNYLTDQYDQVKILHHLPYVIAGGVLALIVLVIGIITVARMRRKVEHHEKWG